MTYYLAKGLVDAHYLFSTDSEGQSLLLDYLHQKKPEHYPNIPTTQSYSIVRILRDLDEIITLESLYDLTNWEVLLLSEPLRRLFGFSSLHYSSLYPKLLKHLIYSHLSFPEGEGSTYSQIATWFTQEPKPLIQQICNKGDPENLSGRYYLSGDLCRLYRLLGRRGVDDKKFFFSQISKTVTEYIHSNPQVIDPGNPLVFRVSQSPLASLGNSQTIHFCQLQPLLQFHCRSEPYFCQKVCNSCNALLS